METFNIASGTEHLFFISDTHFSHQNIIKYCNRPFKTKEEMDHILIQKWNEKVQPEDIVFHLGDFAFGNRSNWLSILNGLNGIKYLIQGNHDGKDSIPEGCFAGIEDMLKLSIWDAEMSTYNEFYLTHFPLATWTGINRGVFNLHGHIHSTPDLQGTGYDIKVAINAPWNQYDVGVDRNNFAPISYDELKVIFTKRMLYGNKPIKNS